MLSQLLPFLSGKAPTLSGNALLTAYTATRIKIIHSTSHTHKTSWDYLSKSSDSYPFPWRPPILRLPLCIWKMLFRRYSRIWLYTFVSFFFLPYLVPERRNHLVYNPLGINDTDFLVSRLQRVSNALIEGIYKVSKSYSAEKRFSCSK